MKKQSMKSRYHESAAEERKEHGYKKSKHPERSFKKFEVKEIKKHAGMEKKEKHKKPVDKMEKVMKEFKTARLHSGSKKGPLVKNRKQAIAIGLSEMRKNKK